MSLPIRAAVVALSVAVVAVAVSATGASVMAVSVFAGSVVLLVVTAATPFPEKEKATSVGGSQFSSLQAPNSI